MKWGQGRGTRQGDENNSHESHTVSPSLSFIVTHNAERIQHKCCISQASTSSSVRFNLIIGIILYIYF